MRHSLLIGMISLGLLFSSAQGKDKVVYGEDNRLDYYQIDNPLIRQLAHSTAALIRDIHFSTLPSGIRLEGDSLGISYNLCSEEKFREQLAVAECTGFLVAPDLLVTAGHCIEGYADCARYSIVFDYLHFFEDQQFYDLHQSQIYNCVEVIGREESRQSDWALIRLDRPAVGRTPFKYNLEHNLHIGDEMAILGHPSGLPLKFARQGFVRANDNEHFFVSTLDSFGGNSGSPVINMKTLKVEGILVRGEDDYIDYPGPIDCKVTKHCQYNECHGEDVTRMSEVCHINGKSCSKRSRK